MTWVRTASRFAVRWLKRLLWTAMAAYVLVEIYLFAGAFLGFGPQGTPSPSRTTISATPRATVSLSVPSDDGTGQITVEPEWHSDDSPVETVPTSGSYSSPDDPENTTPTAVCVDGWVSYSAHHPGTCSHHGGVDYWVTPGP